MTDVLEAKAEVVPSTDADVVLAKVRKYFASRFAMWNVRSTNQELFMFSCARMTYPREMTTKDAESVHAEFLVWSDGGPLPRHVLDWYETAEDDIMHFPR